MISFTTWAEHFIKLPTGKLIRFEPHQRQILDPCFAFDQNGKLPYSVIVYSCPKKSGKTTINAVVMAYWVYNIEAPNEIICVARIRDQKLVVPWEHLY